MKNKKSPINLLGVALSLGVMAAPLLYCYAETAPSFLREIPENTLTLESPWGIATDSESDYFYIADTNDNRIIQFSTTGEGITAAWGGLGDGESAFNAPKGIVLDGMGNVYVVDSGNHRVQKFSHDGSEFILEWGGNGSGSGQFDSPAGIAVDSIGDIFVVDTDNNRVQKFDSNGNYLDEFGSAGAGSAQFLAPLGIDLDEDNNIYVVDTGGDRVQVFDSNGDYTDEFGSSGTGPGEFDMPVDIEINDLGQVFVSDYSNSRVQEFELDGTYIGQFGTEGVYDGEFYGPTGLVFTSDGYINVVDLGNGRVQSFDGYDYEFYRTTHGYRFEEGYFYTPEGLGLSKEGNLYIYVADSVNDRIQKFYGEGDFIESWGSHGASDGDFDMPVDVTTDTSGSIYVVDRDNHRIQEIADDGTFKRKWGSEGSGSGQFQDPTGIAIGSDGNVYVADAGNDRIQKFTQEGTFIGEWGSTGDGNGEFDNPTKVTVKSDGTVYVADTDNNRIQYFTSEGDFLGKFGSSGDGDGEFNSPQGIDIDDDGNIYISDMDNYRVQKFNSDHEFVYKFGSAGAPLNYFGMMGSSVAVNNHGPLDVAVDAEGRLYVLDGINNRIQVFGEDSEVTLHFNHSKNSDGWYLYGTRVSFVVPGEEGVTYQWAEGESGESGHHVKDSKWKDYNDSIETPEGRYTLYWRVEGDDSTYSRYIKTKDEKKIKDIQALLNIEKKNIKLTWELEDTDNVEKVEIYRNDLIKDYDLDTAHLIGTNTPGDLDFTDRFLTSWHDYYYKIAVYDEDGDLEQVRTIFVHVPEIPE
jgi:DNA-binding beta-propeller fold protein YncE